MNKRVSAAEAAIRSYQDSLRGELLWSGRLEWTHDEDSMESIDIPALPQARSGKCVLSVRNGSSTVDVTVNVGHMIKAHPAGAAEDKVWSLGSTGSNTVFQSVGHGLKVGDALLCLTAGDTTCTAGVIYYVHGADHQTAVPANTLYLSLTRAEGGALIDAGPGIAPGTFEIAEEFYAHTSTVVGKFVAGTSIAPILGMETALVEAWPYAMLGGRLEVSKSDITAGNFNVYAQIRRA